MNGFPIIKLSVERMQQTMLHAFSQTQLDISNEVEKALKIACSQESIDSIVSIEAQKCVNEAVKEAMKKWWLTSETGQNLIKQAISEKMEEEAKYYMESKTK